jgi:hypothetical protein
MVEPTQRLTLELGRTTVKDYYEKAVARSGSPIDPDEQPDEELIERGAVRVALTGPAPERDRACAAGPVALKLGADLTLHTEDGRYAMKRGVGP